MNDTVKVYSQAWDVDSRLASLGLTREICLEAVRRGVIGFASCTPNHPVSYPGTNCWAEAFCGLADQLTVSLWRVRSEINQPLLLNPSETIALTVATGDEKTGKVGVDPKTRASKGPRTIEAVSMNGWLFPEMETDVMNRVQRRTRNTWFLLIYRDMIGEQVFSELSLPISLDSKSRIDGWSERIILGSMPLLGDNLSRHKDDDPQMSPEIKVEIKRRA